MLCNPETMIAALLCQLGESDAVPKALAGCASGSDQRLIEDGQLHTASYIFCGAGTEPGKPKSFMNCGRKLPSAALL